MQKSSKHLLIGIITSAFLSPFLGGGIAGYLNGPGIKKGLKTGGIVGTIFGLVVSGILLIFAYYGFYQPISALPAAAGAPDMMSLMFPYLLAITLFFVSSILFALIGGAIGSYVAGHEPPNAGEHGSTS